jgi:hypothetical protein
MARRKTHYQKKAFESSGASSDTSANLYMSMLTSSAWRDLSAKQQVLYTYCKAQYYGEKMKPKQDSECFTMNQSKWCGLYGLYEKGNAKGFYRDMEALIEHGFITCVECGAVTRTKSIYRFSSKWKQYGTDAFEVSPSEMTYSMQRKERLKKT